jgi:probable phosphoglycerate mutase
MTTRLIVWRHGNTDWNAGHRVQGQTDVPLNDLGRQQAVDAADLLVRLQPTALVASDLGGPPTRRLLWPC